MACLPLFWARLSGHDPSCNYRAIGGAHKLDVAACESCILSAKQQRSHSNIITLLLSLCKDFLGKRMVA